MFIIEWVHWCWDACLGTTVPALTFCFRQKGNLSFASSFRVYTSRKLLFGTTEEDSHITVQRKIRVLFQTFRIKYSAYCNWMKKAKLRIMTKKKQNVCSNNMNQLAPLRKDTRGNSWTWTAIQKFAINLCQ